MRPSNDVKIKPCLTGRFNLSLPVTTIQNRPNNGSQANWSWLCLTVGWEAAPQDLS